MRPRTRECQAVADRLKVRTGSAVSDFAAHATTRRLMRPCPRSASARSRAAPVDRGKSVAHEGERVCQREEPRDPRAADRLGGDRKESPSEEPGRDRDRGDAGDLFLFPGDRATGARSTRTVHEPGEPGPASERAGAPRCAHEAVVLANSRREDHVDRCGNSGSRSGNRRIGRGGWERRRVPGIASPKDAYDPLEGQEAPK
jgi:hypothetical protein